LQNLYKNLIPEKSSYNGSCKWNSEVIVDKSLLTSESFIWITFDVLIKKVWIRNKLYPFQKQYILFLHIITETNEIHIVMLSNILRSKTFFEKIIEVNDRWMVAWRNVLLWGWCPVECSGELGQKEGSSDISKHLVRSHVVPCQMFCGARAEGGSSDLCKHLVRSHVVPSRMFCGARAEGGELRYI
jgi:hypothetical protein